VVTLDVDPKREISGISMKRWRDTLSGLRLLDADGDYIVDYTWQPTEETGTWSEVQ
jgi:outer membrane protease